MQQRYGISLKDACHRLYLSETTKLDTIDAAEKTMAVIKSNFDKMREKETLPPIHLIDSGAFDDQIFSHGPWPEVDLATMIDETYL